MPLYKIDGAWVGSRLMQAFLFHGDLALFYYFSFGFVAVLFCGLYFGWLRFHAEQLLSFFPSVSPFLVFVVVLLLLVAEQLRCSLLRTVVFSIHAYSCSSLLRTVLLLLLFFLVVSVVSQLYWCLWAALFSCFLCFHCLCNWELLALFSFFCIVCSSSCIKSFPFFGF